MNANPSGRHFAYRWLSKWDLGAFWMVGLGLGDLLFQWARTMRLPLERCGPAEGDLIALARSGGLLYSNATFSQRARFLGGMPAMAYSASQTSGVETPRRESTGQSVALWRHDHAIGRMAMRALAVFGLFVGAGAVAARPAADCSPLDASHGFAVLNGVEGYAAGFNPEFPGVKRIASLGFWGLWEKGKSRSDVPDVETIRKFADRFAGRNIVYVDIEEWDVVRKPDATIQESRDKYRAAIANVREALGPQHCFGYYGVIPVVDFRRAAQAGTPAFEQWTHENDMMSPLVEDVDFIAPSLYTLTTDRALWREFAKAQLREARRLANGRPVVPFIWPRYHQGVKGHSGEFLEPDFLLEQLQLVAACADGVIFWEYGGREPWRESLPWVAPFREFVDKARTQPVAGARSCD